MQFSELNGLHFQLRIRGHFSVPFGRGTIQSCSTSFSLHSNSRIIQKDDGKLKLWIPKVGLRNRNFGRPYEKQSLKQYCDIKTTSIRESFFTKVVEKIEYFILEWRIVQEGGAMMIMLLPLYSIVMELERCSSLLCCLLFWVCLLVCTMPWWWSRRSLDQSWGSKASSDRLLPSCSEISGRSRRLRSPLPKTLPLLNS